MDIRYRYLLDRRRVTASATGLPHDLSEFIATGSLIGGYAGIS
jgi:hypothetical protein